MDDSYDLDRFVRAQEPLFEAVIAELTAGRKQSHWMWFIFPQLQGLGSSAMAQRFGIRSLAEAHAYLQHALLGKRLRRCTQLVNETTGRSAAQIFGLRMPAMPSSARRCGASSRVRRMPSPASGCPRGLRALYRFLNFRAN